ncbi:hypothetical protein FSP39_007839 [Pinctada imbricata]|uniref:Uncharacterized protein n=1 Tax=Pinctada imbricata TaxID=66713 RepID=A0AA88XZQ0_PINIB|nr:hypothetical protein FSP39_007839 [Pinctada imbricata]
MMLQDPLPPLPAAHILPTYQSLRESATTQQLTDLLNYLDNTLLNNSIWSVQQWSVFMLTVRTNNDTEDWHRRFIGQAGGDKLNIYRLVPALKLEAETIDITVQQVNEQQLTRYQRETYKKTQQKLENLWDRYEDKQNKT